MVSLIFYRCNCDPHTLDKTESVVSSVTIQGTIRGELDVLQPAVYVTGDVSQYNYVYIDALSRFYRITGITRDRTGLSLVRLHVDVLWTYSEQIKALPAVVSRSYRLVNSYLSDDQQRSYQYTQCVNKDIGSPFVYSDYGHIVMTVG